MHYDRERDKRIRQQFCIEAGCRLRQVSRKLCRLHYSILKGHCKSIKERKARIKELAVLEQEQLEDAEQ